MDATAEVVNFISSSLDSGNYKEALNALNETRKERFSDYCYEVIAAAVGKIQDDTIIIKPSLFGACEQLISVVLDKCTPEDALLEFIERLELSKNDAQFGLILPVIQQLLKKVMINKKRSIEWCLYAINNYIDKIKVTEHLLEEDERKLIDNDPNIRRLTKVYTIVITFYQPFVQQILVTSDTVHSKTKPIISDFLLSLLGKPMIFIDVDPNANARSEVRQACQNIIQDICKVEKNGLKFLSQLEYKEKNRIRYTDGSELSPFETCERMNMSTYAGYFYVLYSGHFDIPDTAIPQVYNMLRAGRRSALPFTYVPVSNIQRIIRSYSEITKEQDLTVPAPTPTDQEEQQYEDNVKNRILDRALEFVPKTGWSVESLSAGAKAAGYPTISHGLFPNGGGDLVHYFNVRCNEQLVELMKTWPKEDLKERKVPATFVENAIVTRLQMIEPYKSTWPKAMAIQTMPSNVPNCLATLLSLVDDICYHSGDRSVDFNWYVRRVGLAGIYKTAELFYLTDKTTDNSATRTFVASRIRDAQLVQMALDLNPVAVAPQTLSAAFVTAKNILGINPLK